MELPVEVEPGVREALADGGPVVAMEATVLAQPGTLAERMAAARAIEQVIAKSGAVPAMIGVDGGQVLVGMPESTQERFAGVARLAKVGNRDLGAALALADTGATTCSASMLVAEQVGIGVLATGGIGGVHRQATETFDISADLVQLSRSRVAVVCAGAKSILDLALTLELLETLGVPVLGYRCDDFPAFYSRSSGLSNQRRIDDIAQVARAVAAHFAIGGTGGALVTHPVPEADEIPLAEIESTIEAAQAAAERDGVAGAALTPYLLRSVDAATRGRSTAANRAVLVSSASVGGELAAALTAVNRG